MAKERINTMTTAIIFHEVQDGAVWAKAWEKGPGSRHEMFGKFGIKCRNFRDPNNPNNPNATGVLWRLYGTLAANLRRQVGNKVRTPQQVATCANH
jgi:hypothetical protein